MQGPTTSKNGPSESQVLAPAASPQEITLSETPDEVNSIHESVSTVSSPRDIAIKDNDPEPHRQKVTIWLIALLAGLIFRALRCHVRPRLEGKEDREREQRL